MNDNNKLIIEENDERPAMELIDYLNYLIKKLYTNRKVN